MEPSNHERADRCRKAIALYADCDETACLVDLLTDAMHFCRINGRSFDAALETAVMHFDAEINGDDIDNNIPATKGDNA